MSRTKQALVLLLINIYTSALSRVGIVDSVQDQERQLYILLLFLKELMIIALPIAEPVEIFYSTCSIPTKLFTVFRYT